MRKPPRAPLNTTSTSALPRNTRPHSCELPGPTSKAKFQVHLIDVLAQSWAISHSTPATHPYILEPIPRDTRYHSITPMASRVLLGGARSACPNAASPLRAARSFHATARTFADVVTPLPARKPVGAFRGGLFGFLLGSTLAGSGVYGYVLREYKASNELLQEDIYALQAACQRLNTYVQQLEEKMDAAERKKK
ncbi:hypothetical protein GGR53DRAFT_505921 [Hypoxylon sp. FL1150]|nr:hypothetical protein GGR53DRAFT_505921 [Hypoxylon sp. FL1150]